MTIIAALLAVSLVAVVMAFLYDRNRSENAWTQERGELLTRIQRPELLPVQARPEFLLPEPELDEINLVGAIADPPEED